MTLARYRELVPNWEEFRRAALVPEPTTIRVRRARVSTEELTARLEARGFRLVPVPGVPGFLRLAEEPYPVSQTLEHWLGLFYIQQAVMGLPARALGARPGERVLDLCAAPGGKTTHVADLMEDRGALVAVDVNEKRLRGLLGNLYRMAHPGVISVAADGRDLPGGAAFDRVLVDAPCSAEGNLRSRGGELPSRDPAFVERVTATQTRLLRRAVRLLRPGGTALYATCTFAPEENEAVVERVLAEEPVALEPIPLEARHAPGATRFGDRRFDPALERAWRVWPHQLDSGGLFMARLRKARERDAAAGLRESSAVAEDGARGPPEADDRRPLPAGWESVPSVHPETGASEEEARAWISETRERLAGEWDIPRGDLRTLGWFLRGDSLWLHTCTGWPRPAWEGRGGWRLLAVGLRALKRDRRFGIRFTNDGLRCLGERLGRRVIRLTAEGCRRLLEGGSRPADGAPEGNVAIAVGEDVVGRGVVAGGRLRHEIPRGRAARLLDVLGFEAG